MIFPYIEISNSDKNNDEKAFDSIQKPAIIFLSGFPDTLTSAWGDKIPYLLSKQFRVILVCLPGFDGSHKSIDWGFDYKSLISMLDATFKYLNLSNKKLILVTHGFASYLGILYQNTYPEKIDKMVLLDGALRKTFLLGDMR